MLCLLSALQLYFPIRIRVSRLLLDPGQQEWTVAQAQIRLSCAIPAHLTLRQPIPDNAIRGIERIDLRCNGIQTITLDEDAVLSMSDTNTVEVFLPNDEVDIVNLVGFTPGGAPAAAGIHTAGPATVIITQTTDTEPPLPPLGQPTICSVI
jgi:hypothetical protein